MMSKRTLPILIFLFFFKAVLIGQTGEVKKDTCRIIALKNCKTDSVLLRWAPSIPLAWNHAKNAGFWIERAEVPDSAESNSRGFEKLNQTPIQALSSEQWDNRFKNPTRNSSVAKALLFNKYLEKSKTTSDLEKIIDYTRNEATVFGFTMLYADQDMEVAKALGLGFTDKTIKKDKIYLYRIYFADTSNLFKSDTALIYVDTKELDQVPAMRAPAIEYGDQQITLKWLASKTRQFNSFYIQRAENESDDFKTLNSAPFVKLNSNGERTDLVAFTDSVQNYKQYTYRLVGVTPFGEQSAPSLPVNVMAKDQTPPNPALIVKVTEVEKQTLKIDWIAEEISADQRCFVVARSNKINGEYEPVSRELGLNIRTFVDNKPIGYEGVYYKIFSIDTVGNYSQSLPFYGMLTDSFPPAIPVGLQGFVDTNSVVHLKWNRGDEPDLMGYRVYFANSSDDEFSVLTSYVIPDSLYNDTIQKRTLTKHIYYSISAVDYNYNHSRMSPWVKIRRLDVIPPDAPVLKDVEVKDSSIVLRWFNSSSDDVARHKLLRRSASTKVFLPVAEWEGYPDSTQFIDRNIAPKTFYDYAMVAIDSSNLVSENSPLISVRTFDRGLRPEVNGLKVNHDSEKKSNVIEWNYSQNGEYSFLLYRSYQNLGLVKFAKVEGGKTSYIDSDLIGNGQYSYAVKAVFKDGGESPVTKAQSVFVD
jgi:hypothetical protein